MSQIANSISPKKPTQFHDLKLNAIQDQMTEGINIAEIA